MRITARALHDIPSLDGGLGHTGPQGYDSFRAYLRQFMKADESS